MADDKERAPAKPGIQLEANTRYQIDYVLNGAVVVVKAATTPHVIHFYPAGTANPAGTHKDWGAYPPNQLWSIEGPGFPVSCPPGAYHILYNFGHGAHCDWRNGVRLNVGDFVELK